MWQPLTCFLPPDSNLLKRPAPLDEEAKPLIWRWPLWPALVKGAVTSCLRSVWGCWVLKQMRHHRDANCLFCVLDLIKAACLCVMERTCELELFPFLFL